MRRIRDGTASPANVAQFANVFSMLSSHHRTVFFAIAKVRGELLCVGGGGCALRRRGSCVQTVTTNTAEYSGRDFALIATAFVGASVRAPNMFIAIAQHTIRRMDVMDTFTTRYAVNVAWCAATLVVAVAVALSPIARECVRGWQVAGAPRCILPTLLQSVPRGVPGAVQVRDGSRVPHGVLHPLRTEAVVQAAELRPPGVVRAPIEEGTVVARVSAHCDRRCDLRDCGQAEAAPKGSLLRSVIGVLAALSREGFPKVAVNYRTEENFQVPHMVAMPSVVLLYAE